MESASESLVGFKVFICRNLTDFYADMQDMRQMKHDIWPKLW